MEIVLILVTAAGLFAAAAGWWLSRSADRRAWGGDEPARLVGFRGGGDDAGSEFFAFAPSADAVIREDRPSPAISVARLALAIAVSTVVLVGAVWAIGFLLKLQLDRYFLSGG